VRHVGPLAFGFGALRTEPSVQNDGAMAVVETVQALMTPTGHMAVHIVH